MTVLAARRLAVVVMLVLGVGGCAATSPPPAPAKGPPATGGPPPVAVPAWQVGDRWVYEWTSGKETGTKTAAVVGVRSAGSARYYVVRLDGDVHHYYTDALHWAAAVRDGKVEARMVPPQPWFQWPLAPGAHWSGRSRFEQRGGAVTHDDRFSVVGPETIDVPAGRYETIKVTREGRGDGDEYWYAPAVGWYVRWIGRRGDVRFEEHLREYHPAPRPR